MRDGWVAFLTLVGVYYLIKRNFRAFIVVLCFLLFIRTGSGILLLSASLFYFGKSFLKGATIHKIPKLISVVFILVITIYLSLPYLLEYLTSKGFDGVDRQDFVDSIIKEADADSIIFKIYSLPFYLKVPIGFVFFFFLPFFRGEFYTLGILNIRSIMTTIIMPILSLFYFKYLFSGIFYFFKKNKNKIKYFFFVYCFCLLLISQMSIQPRHKTSIMPFFYIFVAYGLVYNTRYSKKISGILFFVLLFLQLYMLI